MVLPLWACLALSPYSLLLLLVHPATFLYRQDPPRTVIRVISILLLVMPGRIALVLSNLLSVRVVKETAVDLRYKLALLPQVLAERLPSQAVLLVALVAVEKFWFHPLPQAPPAPLVGSLCPLVPLLVLA